MRPAAHLWPAKSQGANCGCCCVAAGFAAAWLGRIARAVDWCNVFRSGRQRGRLPRSPGGRQRRQRRLRDRHRDQPAVGVDRQARPPRVAPQPRLRTLLTVQGASWKLMHNLMRSCCIRAHQLQQTLLWNPTIAPLKLVPTTRGRAASRCPCVKMTTGLSAIGAHLHLTRPLAPCCCTSHRVIVRLPRIPGRPYVIVRAVLAGPVVATPPAGTVAPRRRPPITAEDAPCTVQSLEQIPTEDRTCDQPSIARVRNAQAVDPQCGCAVGSGR